MNAQLQKTLMVITLLSTSLSMIATHYINHTGRMIVITNVSAHKRTKKSYLTTLKAYFNKKNQVASQEPEQLYFIELENEAEGDLDNNQDDEITITSKGMSDKRKLFPTNNFFNYAITLNKYSSKYEKFDINHAGQEETTKAQKEEVKKMKKMKRQQKQSNQ